jgi:hypothetical protein
MEKAYSTNVSKHAHIEPAKSGMTHFHSTEPFPERAGKVSLGAMRSGSRSEG